MTDIAELLSREIGSGRVVQPNDARLADYGHDESHLTPFAPECAVICGDAEQVSTVLRIAAEQEVPVTPRGAGSGMTGGCLPVRGGIVLSTEAMTRILDIDSDDLVAVVEPGVITGALQTQVEELGLFYPPDPASLDFCSIGGNAATNAGGPRAFKYGVTREYVLGLDVALMGGEQLTVGRRTSKGVTGYDLVAGFVGSEGTFGVITKLVLKLLPKPAASATLLAIFAKMENAGAAVTALIHRGFRPRALEIADRVAIDHVRKHASYRFPDNAGAIALIEVDGDPEGLDTVALRIGDICEQNAALDILMAQNAAERRRLWQARRLISPSLKAAFRHKESEDICVPRGQIPEMLRRIDRIARSTDLEIATFGHAGDGNLHVNLLCDRDGNDPVVRNHLDAALHELFRDTIELRGTLSGEHGIGLAKRDFLPMEQSAAVIEWQRRWKRMWDPRELLNPGKILPPHPRMCHE